GAVPFLRAGVGSGAEGGEGAVGGGREHHGDAGTRVVKGLDDVGGEALEAVDVAPGGLPGSEVGGEFVGGGGEGFEQNVGRGVRDGFFIGAAAAAARESTANVFAPEDAERRRDGFGRPAIVPRFEHGDLIGELRLHRA